jgi:steroid delta-isomerase-like uncharacterized protein
VSESKLILLHQAFSCHLNNQTLKNIKMKSLKFTLLVASLSCVSLLAFSQNPSSNKMVVRKYFEEIINKQKPELLLEVFSKDYLFLSLEDGYSERGIEQLQKFLPLLFKAFPDIHYTIDQLIAEDNKVVVQTTTNGTQKGAFWSYPASNNKIKISEVFFFTLLDHKIIENRRLIDLFHLDKQLMKRNE